MARWRGYRVNAEPLRNAAGPVQGAVATFADVTEERGKLTELRETFARLSHVLEGSNDGYWDVGDRNRPIDLQPAMGADAAGVPPGRARAKLRRLEGKDPPTDNLQATMAAVEASSGRSNQWLRTRATGSRHKDGRSILVISVEVASWSGARADGRYAAAGTHTDITG